MGVQRSIAADGRRIQRKANPSLKISDAALDAAQERIDQAAGEIRQLHNILAKVDKHITAAAKRAIKRTDKWPLRLNSKSARARLAIGDFPRHRKSGSIREERTYRKDLERTPG